MTGTSSMFFLLFSIVSNFFLFWLKYSQAHKLLHVINTELQNVSYQLDNDAAIRMVSRQRILRNNLA